MDKFTGNLKKLELGVVDVARESDRWRVAGNAEMNIGGLEKMRGNY